MYASKGGQNTMTRKERTKQWQVLGIVVVSPLWHLLARGVPVISYVEYLCLLLLRWENYHYHRC